jgi:hypothetical protein
VGDGNTSNYRWQPDRQLTLREKFNKLYNDHMQLRSAFDYEVEQNIQLRRENDKLSKLVAFKRGDEVRK